MDSGFAGFIHRRFRGILAAALYVALCVLNSPLTAENAPMTSAGHVVVTAPFHPGLARVETRQPGARQPEITPSFRPGSPQRDDGRGDLLWTQVDENGITDHVCISSNGRWAAVGYTLNDERLEIRNAASGNLLGAFPVDHGSSQTAISADGSLIIYGAMDNIYFFRHPGGAQDSIPPFNMQGHSPGPLALTRDGSFAVISGVDPNSVSNKLWGLEVGADEPDWTVDIDAQEAWGWYGMSLAEESLEGGRVAVNGKYHMYVLDMLDGDIIWSAPTYNSEGSVRLSEDGMVLVIGSLSGRLRTFAWQGDRSEYCELWHYSFTGAQASWVTSVAVSPDGQTVAAGSLDFFEDRYEGRVAVFDACGFGEPIWMSRPFGDEISDIKFDHSGGIFAVTSWGDFNNETADMAVFETHNPEPIFQAVTPGSLDGLDISDDGRRIIAGGKAVHNRQFGRGGRFFVVQTTLLGGLVSGCVVDTEGFPIWGAVVTAADNPYSAATNESGEYSLRIEMDEDIARVDLAARLRAFMDDTREAIQVQEGQETVGIDFELAYADEPPDGLRATQGARNRVTLQWENYNGRNLGISCEGGFHLAVNGSRLSEPSVTGDGTVVSIPPRRDHASDAEAINIYRSAASQAPFRLIATVGGDADRYIDEHRLIPRTTYYYAVTADFGNGESSFSNVVEGSVDDSFLNWGADLESMPRQPRIDGRIEDGEWEGAAVRDISDVFGYDRLDTAGTVEALIGFSDESDRLYLAFRYYYMANLAEGLGVGIYVDDDGDGEWTYDRPASEGNYWGYWREGAPWLAYRSLSGPPYNVQDHYFIFEDPPLAFSADRGYVEMEASLPLGFHSPEEIAVYRPDSEIGLGLFAKHNQGENAIFDGWWPQDMMSIVTNPEQFARVSIPVHLIVPPQAPEDARIERAGRSLEVSWLDPSSGVDGNEIGEFEGIVVKRNGDSLGVVPRGEEMYLDEEVSELGWYEYVLAGYVMESGTPFLGPYSPAVGCYAVREPEIRTLQYDDGSMEAWYIVEAQGVDNRFAVDFQLDDMRDTVAVYWAEFIPRSASPILLYIAGNDNGIPGEAISDTFLVQPTVAQEPCRFHFPGLSQPRIIIDPNDFNDCWIVLRYLETSPGAPALGVDTNGQNGRLNKYYQPNSGWRDFTGGRLMVRGGLGPAPALTPAVEPPPDSYYVGSNFPNPFNRTTLVPLELPAASDVSLAVYSIDGRLVRYIFAGHFNIGRHSIPFYPEGLAAGLYFLRVNAGAYERTIKAVIIN